MNVVFTIEVPAPRFSKKDDPDEVAAALKTYIEKCLRLAGVFPFLLEAVKVSYQVKPSKHPPAGESLDAHT